MQRSSCSRLRASTSPNVLTLLIASSFLIVPGRDTGRIRTVVSALCRRAPRRWATVSQEPPRGVEPLHPGSKPGALPPSYGGWLNRCGRRDSNPQQPVSETGASARLGYIRASSAPPPLRPAGALLLPPAPRLAVGVDEEAVDGSPVRLGR